MSGDDYTRLRMAWLDQVFSDEALSKSVATNVAFFISQHFNRKRFGDSGVLNAWPSYATLAGRVGCSEKSVQRAVSLLRNRGHIKTRHYGGGHVSLQYFAVISSRSRKNTRDTMIYGEGGQKSPPCSEIDGLRASGVDTGVHQGGHERPSGVDVCVPQTSLNKSLNEISDIGTQTENEPTPQTLHPADRQKAREEGSELDVQRITPAAAAVAVLSVLIKGPGPLPPPPPIVRRDPRPEWLMDHQAQHGWPNVYENFGNPERWADAFDDLAYEMEPVAASEDNRLWRQWSAVYRNKGWPLPPAQGQLVHFPDCGPKGFDRFLARLKAALNEQAIGEASNVLRITSR